LNSWPRAPYELSFSVGYAQLDALGLKGDLRAALHLADSRMYAAKYARRSGRNGSALPKQTSSGETLGTLEADLVAALDAKLLRPAFQPIIDLHTGELVAFEALARWHHPTRGEVSPGVFIPVAEENGHIGRLGEFVLNSACEHMSLWRADGLPQHVKFSVNVSRSQLHDHDFVSGVLRLLEASDLPASALQLEVTESLAMDDDNMRSALAMLREAGISVSLDDFGTGHSSLAALHRLPVSQLKIDRAFISELTSSAYHRAVVKAALDIAGTLDLEVVAEGVETREQSEMLMSLGCGLGQGWLFSKALEAYDVPDFLAGMSVFEMS
jgi:EAL domain-containing protein (putative c-di-GMP-specific phosphodiesterase class I)